MRAAHAAALGIAVAALAASSQALAHGRFYGPRVHLGVVVGPPVYWHPAPAYYYPPYYYHPRALVVPAAPPTYIERPEVPEADAQDYWYWCADARAYYPYVKECSAGWQRVTPRAPGG